MMRRYRYNNIVKATRLLSLVVLMTFGAGLKGWGQTIYKHGTTTKESFVPQTDVPTRVDTLYILNGETRTLTIPDFKGITGEEYTSGYRWYMHWYRAMKTENGYELQDAGDILTKKDFYYNSYCVLVQTGTDNKSFFWHTGISGYPRDASYINYSANGSEDIVICDISHNLDVDGTSTPGANGILRNNNGNLSFADSKDSFVEPTIARRFMFIIKNPDDSDDGIRTRLDYLGNLNDNTPLETLNITVPEGASNVNLQMSMTPENYYWRDTQGSSFIYYINGQYEGTSSSRIISLPSVSDGDIVNVYATDNNVYATDNNLSPIIARFVFDVQDDAGFMKDDAKLDQIEDRNPSKNTDKYQEIASYDFDFDEETSVLSAENNLRLIPMPSDECSYAFIAPSLPSVMARLNPRQNLYGLYRSANVNGISNNIELSPSISWGKGYSQPNPSASNKNYDWYFCLSSGGNTDQELYDRTHVDDNGKYGYFLYLDATEDADRVVNVTLDGSLCDGTELAVIAWVANMSNNYSENNPKTLPNLNLIFRGYKSNDAEGEVIHRFTTGDLPSKAIADIGVWYQLYYKIRIPSGANVSYVRYTLEVQNNTKDSNGADYAIDDVRIYKTLPNIEVVRQEACDASKLVISTDFETILRNMGWNMDEEISDIQQVLDDPELIKFRFGLRGDAALDDYPQVDMHAGNAYFSFLEGLEQDENSGSWTSSGKKDVTGQKDSEKLESGEYRWVKINKNLPEETTPDQSYYSLRVVVATDARSEDYPNTQEEALVAERILNLRAVKDYNYFLDHWDDYWKQVKPDETVPDKPTWLTDGPIDLKDLSEDNVNTNISTYNDVIQELYSRLQIPRIRCPWFSEDKSVLYLCPVDVDDTDLKYNGEIVGVDNNGVQVVADGLYQVILFSAIDVNRWSEGSGISTGPDLGSPCNMISGFTVNRSVRIRVNTVGGSEGLICAGTQRQIKAELLNKDTGEPLEDDSFGFDWFLGTKQEYDQLTTDGVFGGNVTLAQAINQYRTDEQDDDSFDREAINNWEPTQDNETMKIGLLKLFDDEERVWLLTDKSNDFTILLESESIMAMPFIKTQVDGTLYCTEITEVPFDNYSNEVPKIYPGLHYVDYGELTDIPVRVGLRHISSGKELTIPLRKEIDFALGTESESKSHSLIANPNNKNVSLYVDNMPSVAELTDLSVAQGGTSNSLTLKFIDHIDQDDIKFKEGQEYVLLIPFVESADGNTALGTACDGLARLTIKVVPEYLTWQGDGSDVWYNDDNWNQSTEGELYMGNETPNKDANGDDEITNAFAPLYFTKITIPNGEQLTLDEPKKNGVNDIVLGFGDKNSVATANIQYDMAVDTVIDADAQDKLTVVPYYINKVSEIYFKPEATLMNQHYLFYDTARVEFTMKQNTPYWMASPLKEVYAGDLYAPTGGTQNTSAFNHIVFNETKYDRWSPAFYQKAWNKAVAYMDSDEETVSHDSDNAIDVSAVKSNWSIEYNDVWVPYPIGKGFYASVEGVAGDEVTVRLPKADTEYHYQTKAANNLSPDPKFSDGRRRITDENGVVTGGAGQLATEKPTFTRNENFAFSYSSNGNVTLNLNDVYGESSTDIDQGEHRHFLVGNPYMTYLDMEEFLNVNNGVLTGKYWTLENGAPNAVVGTPDVDFEGDNRTLESVSGTVKPMTAFFVELKNEATSTIITFTDKMMASTEQTATPETKSLTASNPILTLTAERGETRSVARLLTSDKGHDAYEASEDAVLLLDSELDAPMVYTVAGDVAAQFNTMQSIRNVPLGVYADKGEEVELTIRGISQFADKLYLYDAVTKQSIPMDDDSYTFRVTGPSHGRFTLTSQNRISAESDICVYSPIAGQLLVMSSPEEALQRVQVYDMSGRMVVSRDNIRNTTCQLSLASGIYIVYAENESGNVRVKIRIR